MSERGSSGLPRSQIGPYRLLRRIGQGGMAEVYEAMVYGGSSFEKKVAIKVLLPELRGRGDLERILIDEARLGARLVHRNLVQVHDLGLDGDIYYVRMDLIDGADLASLIRPASGSSAASERRVKCPPVELSLLVAEEIAVALDFVHRFCDDAGRPLGLVHRDISPSNILISRSGEVKLADFGIAKATHLTEITRGNVRKGKYAYMSPEQVDNQRLTSASDQFALGVTLMELCLGRRPYDAESVMGTMERIRQAAPPDLHGLGGELPTIIRRCLARDPAARYATTEQLRRELARLRRYLPLVTCSDLGQWVREQLDHTRTSDEKAARSSGDAVPLSEAVTAVFQEPRPTDQLTAPNRETTASEKIGDEDKVIVTLT
ncbi:MAG: serine/threonine protein kinase [Myxococcales bacterium]|nr:serine/threonine protein kinase [Myxococcales bacterium]